MLAKKSLAEQDRIVNFVKRKSAEYKEMGIDKLKEISSEKRSKYDTFAYNVALHELTHKSSLEAELEKYPNVKNYREFAADRKMSVYFEFHAGNDVYPIVHHSHIITSSAQRDLFFNEVLSVFKRNLPHYLKTKVN